MKRSELFITAALMAVRGAAAVASGGARSPDSVRYRNDEDPLLVFRVDLAQGPGQLPQVIHLLPMGAALAVQAAVAACLWVAAASVATRGMSRWWFWAAVAFGLSPWWLGWDWAVLSESLVLGAMALFAAGSGRWMSSREAAVPMMVGAGIALLARPMVAPLVLGMLTVILLARREVPRPRLAAGAVALLIVAGLVQSAMFNASTPSYEYVGPGTTMAGIQASDRMAARWNNTGYLEAAASFGMPQCEIPGDLDEGFAGSATLRELPCAGMSDWLNAGGLPWWAELIHLPGTTLREVVAGEWTADTWQGYMRGSHLVPQPIAVAVDVLMWLALATACGAIVTVGGPHRGARTLIALGALGYALVLILVDGQENWRHILPALVVLVPFALGVFSRQASPEP